MGSRLRPAEPLRDAGFGVGGGVFLGGGERKRFTSPQLQAAGQSGADWGFAALFRARLHRWWGGLRGGLLMLSVSSSLGSHEDDCDDVIGAGCLSVWR